MSSRLNARDLTISYGAAPVLSDLSLDLPDGKITAIVGPNACGKSTLLKSLARLIRPKSGAVMLDGAPVHRQKTTAVARAIALLPQSAEAPAGMRVRDLVARGRTPHQTPLAQWSAKDARIVEEAMAQVDLADQADTELVTLSGGQRQRAWIAMVLAQQTDILLLDEPTTFLDLRHQIDILKLVRQLQAERDLTVVMVLHDINLAARFSDHIVALRGGEVLYSGPPNAMLTPERIRAIYDLEAEIIPAGATGIPHVIPL